MGGKAIPVKAVHASNLLVSAQSREKRENTKRRWREGKKKKEGTKKIHKDLFRCNASEQGEMDITMRFPPLTGNAS